MAGEFNPFAQDSTGSGAGFGDNPLGDVFDENYYNLNPVAGFSQWLKNLGPGASGPGLFGNWLRSDYNRYYGDYSAQAPQHPNLKWLDYLNTQDPTRDYMSLGATQRGENPSNYVPRTRWIG